MRSDFQFRSWHVPIWKQLALSYLTYLGIFELALLKLLTIQDIEWTFAILFFSPINCSTLVSFLTRGGWIYQLTFCLDLHLTLKSAEKNIYQKEFKDKFCASGSFGLAFNGVNHYRSFTSIHKLALFKYFLLSEKRIWKFCRKKLTDRDLPLKKLNDWKP